MRNLGRHWFCFAGLSSTEGLHRANWRGVWNTGELLSQSARILLWLWFHVRRNPLIFKLKDTSTVCIFVMIDSDHCCSGYSYHLTHRRHWNRFGRTANVRAQSPSRSWGRWCSTEIFRIPWKEGKSMYRKHRVILLYFFTISRTDYLAKQIWRVLNYSCIFLTYRNDKRKDYQFCYEIIIVQSQLTTKMPS